MVMEKNSVFDVLSCSQTFDLRNGKRITGAPAVTLYKRWKKKKAKATEEEEEPWKRHKFLPQPLGGVKCQGIDQFMPVLDCRFGKIELVHTFSLQVFQLH